MGTWAACMHGMYACLRHPLSVMCTGAKSRDIHKHTPTHTCAPSHGKGGVTIAFTAAALRVAQPDEFFRVPAHTYHTRLGATGATSSETCATCEAGKYSNAGASRV